MLVFYVVKTDFLFIFRAYFGIYIFFLIAMSVALLIKPPNVKYNDYSGPNGALRLVSELVTLGLTCAYILSELKQWHL